MIIKLAFAGVALFSSCVPARCNPSVPSAPVAPVETNCEGTISWDGRSPVNVIRVPDYEAQSHLDNGGVVNIGTNGYEHVAGHYSSHGAVFRNGPRLGVGSVINYDCTNYVVTGRGSASAGDMFNFQPGLTVQYSGCGGVCLVFAQ